MRAFQPKQKQPLQRTPTAIAKPGAAHSKPLIEARHAGFSGSHPRFAYEFAGISVFPPRVSGIQRKLMVNVPGDACEQNADLVADQVMRRPETSLAAPTPVSQNAHVQTGAAAQASRGVEAPPIVHEVLRSPGQPLDAATRTLMEPRFRHDFSRVRVHNDSRAAESAKALHARAYTLGSDIAFGPGEYASGTARGRGLLAHELAHVVQQKANTNGRLIQRAPDDSELGKLPEADKQTLKVDREDVSTNLPSYFSLGAGTLVTATNVDADYNFATPSIEALKDEKKKSALRKGLRAYAMGTFDLVPDKDGKAKSPRLNLVHIENLDLTKWGGPNTSFRLTSKGETSKGGATKMTILIEELALATKPMADPAALKGIEATASKYGLKPDSSLPDSVWQRILGALGKIQEALLMRIRDVTFDASPDARGPDGEPAAYNSVFKSGAWTRKITIFQDMVNAKDTNFAFLLAHEIGHAIDFAPREGATGVVKDAEVHNATKFKEAATKDGGRAKAITDYGKTSDKEFFAECFAMFIQQRETLKALRPNIYAYFVEYEFGALKDPKLNPYYKAPGTKSSVGTPGPVGPF